MKYKSYDVSVDPCQTSIDLLRERCEAYFRSEDPKSKRTLWFVDHFEACPPNEGGGPIDVVFFGGFLRRFFETGNWTGKSFRFWCLSKPSRAVMSRQLGIPAECIAIIPREKLFVAPEELTSFPSRDLPMTFVYGGRLSPTKNVELLVRTVNHLQMDHGFDAELILSGKFDNEDHPDRGRWFLTREYSEAISNLISDLTWRKQPRIRESLAPKNWYLEKYENPVYFNFSTFMCEDFNVSLAQAQSVKWPAVISDWGGHLDVPHNESVIKIHPTMIGHTHEGAALTALRAKSLAASIAKRWGKSAPSTSVGAVSKFTNPKPISIQKIDELRRSLIESGSMHRLWREGPDGFAYDAAGEKFFAAYRALFSGVYVGSPIVVLVNDLNTSSSPAVQNIDAICSSVLEEALRSGCEVVFVPVREVLHPQFTLLLSHAAKIVVPFWTEALEQLLRFWILDWKIAAPVNLVLGENLAGEARARLKGFLRSGDSVMNYEADPNVNYGSEPQHQMSPI